VQVRVRAAPLQLGSPVATELRGKPSCHGFTRTATHSHLASQQQPHQGDLSESERGSWYGGGSTGAMGQFEVSDGGLNAPCARSSDAGDAAADIIGFEQRKVRS